MRKPMYTMPRDEAVALLTAAPVVHIASTDPEGAPIFRTVNAVVIDDFIAFHGAPVGEKTEALGRACVLACEEIVASIPSHFIDPERACPATTYYRSVQVHGVLEEVTDMELKARVLAELTSKFQPEGGHVPISATHPFYRKGIAGLLVVRVSLERLTGKAKLGQNRQPAELAGVLEKLWGRGLPGDPRTIELVRAANPSVAAPPFLAAPEGAVLSCAPGPADVDGAVALVKDEYWNTETSPESLARAHLGSTAWVVARALLPDKKTAVIATARALSDLGKRAWIYDVGVAPAWRGRGLGRTLLRLLLDHPTMRDVGAVWLGTRDAQPFYERFGFQARETLPPRPYATTEMVMRR